MTEMTYNEAIEWMDSRHWSGTGKGIVRSQELLERLGNPQDKLKFVHVAGTNGKGSVCACLSKILTAAGYQVGLFVSPHLKRFNDRIYFNGTEIGDEDFARLASCIRAQAEVMEDAPTVFEIMTAMGMLYFAEKQCDLVMLEVGMGGRLDSTNVIRTPEAAVITSIGLDHTKELGDTLEKIAGEKGGIIKTGGTVIVDGQDLSHMTDEELTIFRRRNIGFVFQQYNLVPMLNVWENIILPVKLDGKKIEKKYVDEIIDTLGIRTKLENLPSALSGGQQQRVAIARALAAKPAILLADEPTGNLDSKTSQDVLGLLKVTSKRFHQTIVMITHNEEIAQMADRILQIEDGKIVSDSGLV